jgi:hypothetical protein
LTAFIASPPETTSDDYTLIPIKSIEFIKAAFFLMSLGYKRRSFGDPSKCEARSGGGNRGLRPPQKKYEME